MKKTNGLLFDIFLILLIMVAKTDKVGVAAQSRTSLWAPRQRIPGTHDEAETPYLVADQNKTVHAFHSQPSGADERERAIVYSKWTPDSGWTLPTDIILPPFGWLAVIRGAYLDHNGVIHIIFFGGEERDANIYYSWAPAVDADKARAWSVPEVIGEHAIVQTAAMAADEFGNLFVLYGGDLEGNGLYWVYSEDDGKSWSSPESVSLTVDNGHIVYAPRLYIEPDQQLHAVWAVNDSSGTGQEIYYARLDVREMKWAKPISLAMADQVADAVGGIGIDRVGWPSTVKYRNDLIAIYMVCSPCERRMRISYDDGQTWTIPVEPFHPSRGEYGAAEFAIDSNNVLHVILGDRARGWDLWHTIWQNGYWAEPEPIVPPVELQIYPEGPETFAPQAPHAVFSNGNVLLATWQTDRGSTHNGTWYSYKTLDAPELPLIPLPTLVETSAESPAAIPTIPNSTPTPMRILIGQSGLESYSSGNPGGPLFLGVIPVIILISAIIIIYSFRSYDK